MKTKEFFSEIEALGLKIDNCNGDLLIGDTKRNYCRSSSEERYRLEVYHEHLEKLEEDVRHKLLDMIIEYIKTPVEERKEDKKYYLKLPLNSSHCLSYLNYNAEYGAFNFASYTDSHSWKTQFTQEEIDNLPNQEFIKSLIKEEL